MGKEVNQFEKNNVGRPPMFKTVKELEKKIAEYFDYIKEEKVFKEKLSKSDYLLNYKTIYDGKELKGYIVTTKEAKPPTVTGLALYLGFSTRQSMYDYKEKEKFTYTIKRACVAIENHYEQGLNNPASSGFIFALKNMGWSDKQEIDHTTKGKEIQQGIRLSNGSVINLS